MEWYLSDHLGSTTLLVNESGLEVERTEYYPYGEVQSGGLEKYGFTGQENDADTELMYYGARYYSPEYRVFVQPDTMLPDPYNPQALNRYAYTLNNPVKYNDPTGHYIESGIDIAFLAMDLNDIRTGNANTWTYVGLAADVACLALPGATGGRLAVKALEEGLTHGDDILAAGKTAGKFIDGADTIGDAGKALDSAATFNKLENINNIENGFTDWRAAEAELLDRVGGGVSQERMDTSFGTRIVDVLDNSRVAHESKVGYVSNSASIRNQVQKDAELIQSGAINGATWHFYRSGVTGKIGPSKQLISNLEKNGIDYIIHDV
jgi:RHS repeat-associated protein